MRMVINVNSTTTLFDVDELTDIQCEKILNDVYESLEERGYNPINQLTGYLISGDPGYISNHREARSKISSIERDKIISFLLRKNFNK